MIFLASRRLDGALLVVRQGDVPAAVERSVFPFGPAPVLYATSWGAAPTYAFSDPALRRAEADTSEADLPAVEGDEMEGMQTNAIQAAGGYGPPGGGGYGGPPPGGFGPPPGGAPPGGFGPPPGAPPGGFGPPPGAPPGGFGPPPGAPGGFGPPGGMPPAGGYGAPQGFGAPGGFPPPGGPMMPGAGGDVNTTLAIVLSIVSIFFCCIPGIVAIVFAVQANSAKNAGDIEGARSKAKTATIIAAVSIGLGILGAIGNALNH